MVITWSCQIPDDINYAAVIETKSASNIDTTFATIHGKLIDEGCKCASINRGFIFSTIKKDLLNGTTINLGDGIRCSITYNLTNLKSNTTYYYNTYAINSIGKQYGLIDSFKTKSNWVDSLIIHPKSEWEFKLVTPESEWKTNYETWVKGRAPFGNLILTGYFFNYVTFWPFFQTLYVRKKVSLNQYNLNSIQYHIGVDNGYELYVNGNFVSKNFDKGAAFKWEYEGKVPKTFLNNGENIIAIILIDTGGTNSFDMQLTGKAK